MDEKLIQKFFNSLEPNFALISHEKDHNGDKNSIYWENQLEAFLESVKDDFEKPFLDTEPEIKRDFIRLLEMVSFKLFETYERVFIYKTEKKERVYLNSISIKWIDLKQYLLHLEGISTSIKYISQEDIGKANKIKKLFVYHLERFLAWLKHNHIIISKSPLNTRFQEILQSYKDSIDIKEAALEAELSKISERPIMENHVDLSDTSTSEKIIYLHELGIIDFLRSQFEYGTSNNNLASIISSFTGSKPRTIQSYINPINNKSVDQKKSPLSNSKKVEEIRLKLIELGVINQN